jgi:hypothetical protein
LLWAYRLSYSYFLLPCCCGMFICFARYLRALSLFPCTVGEYFRELHVTSMWKYKIMNDEYVYVSL